MAKRLLPTTKTQVSGHRFMRRRVEHGLIFGDVRMIHDPLGSRRRAMIFGLVAVCMISGVMGLFAWMRPNPDPGDAPILRAADGTLYVRVEDAAHPVTNLTSARLIAGGPAEPARVGDEYLTALARGVPVGIVTAPSMFATDANTHDAWSACTSSANVVVRAGDAPSTLAADEAVLAVADSREWVVTATGRTVLPPSTTPEGRILRRGLGIDASTPRWEPPAEVLVAIRELPPFAFPSSTPAVLRTEAGSWLRTASGGVQEVTPLQEQLLIDASAQRIDLTQADIATYPDADPPVELQLPELAPTWVDPETRAICASPDGGGASLDQDEAMAGAMTLSGSAVATHFAGLAGGSVATDSGHGFHVIAGNGLRHPVPQHETLEMIGVERIYEVAWPILALLPEGEELTREAALVATY